MDLNLGRFFDANLSGGALLMAQKTKILRVITRLNVGGPSCHVQLLMKNLDPGRFEQRLIVGSVPKGEIEDEQAAKYVHGRLTSLKRSLSLISDFQAVSQLKKEIATFQPDIIHSHQAKAGFLITRACSGSRQKVVHTYHGHTFSGYWGPIMGRMVIAAERKAARRRDLLVAQSNSQIEEIVGALGENLRPKMRLIPPAIDLERLDPGRQQASLIRSELGLTRERVLVFLGRLAAIKNPAAFLRVVARVQKLSNEPVVALVVGGGTVEEENRLHDLIDELDLRASIRWLGYRQDVSSILALADVCVSTSINEGTPLSLLEALYCGAKIAAFDVGGIRDILGKKEGVKLVDPRDEESLARVVHEHLLSNELGMQTVAETRKGLIQAYGIGRLAVDLQAVYEGLLRE
ncbi:MAG: glycosyltransferase involved in cell wall biosynthesis [Planctomycetota bacterium]|jgi:glycosyltransferase involved in cell wall biosynthesis